MLRAASVATVLGYVRLDRLTGDGFVLPLARKEGSADWLVQQMSESSDKVISFRSFRGEVENLSPMENPFYMEIGKPQIYAFVVGSVVHVGTKSELASVLKEYIGANSKAAAINFQISSVTDLSDERQSSRLQMGGLIRRASGQAAESLFYKSSLDSMFISKISTAWDLAPNSERKRDIFSNFEIISDEIGGLKIEGVEPLSFFEREKLDEIAADLTVEFELPALHSFKSKTIDFEIDPLERIVAAKRQEERISLIFLEILKDEQVGLSLLQRYRPKAAFEKYAIARAREKLDGRSLFDNEFNIYELTRQLFSKSFPINRGYLMEYLSKHLSIYPRINRAILQQITATTSVLINTHREAILANLENT